MLLLAAVLRLGFVANFISLPVLVGFKSGIGLVIILDQLPKLFGVHIQKENFFLDLYHLGQALPHTSWLTLGSPSLPWWCWWSWSGVFPIRPHPCWGESRHSAGMGLGSERGWGCHRRRHSHRPAQCDHAGLDPGAAAVAGGGGIALMSFTETIAAGSAFVGKEEPEINPNRELVATGLANLGAPVWQHAGRGGTSQTAVVRSVGGMSQRASVVTAVMALATMIFLAPLLSWLPSATLAVVVIVYSVGLIQPGEFRKIGQIRMMEFRWAVIACLGCCCSVPWKA